MREGIHPEIIAAEINLRKISGMIKQNGRKILKNYPITSTQFIALQWITESDNLTIGELSSKIGLAFSTTTDLVDRMETHNLVKRKRDLEDRRVVRVCALAKGEEIIKDVIEKRQDYLGEVLSAFSDEEAERLNESLARLLCQMNIVHEKQKKAKR